MKIGIIGAGNVGTGLGKRLAEKGHEILIGLARTPEKVFQAVALIGRNARAGSPLDVAQYGSVTILATPWAITLDVVRELEDALAGRILWDTTNPFRPTMDELSIGASTSAGEEIAHALPRSNVVKAIPPFADLMRSTSMLVGGHNPAVFVCGDDIAARRAIVELVSDIDADAINAGPLKLARFTEPTGMLVTNLAYVQGFGARLATALIREPVA